MMKMKKPELLSPAGDWEKLQMAVLYGADAVYLAGTSFGMRSFAGNFSDEELPRAVDSEMARQAAGLSRREVIEASLRDFGCAIVCGTLDDCARLADEIAPEHMEIVTRDPEAVMERIHNAGAVFLGGYTPEPLGDYMAGPDHVLPTSGTARFFSPLSVDAFVKKTSVLKYTREELARVKDEIITLARAEHLTAHANSIQVRFSEN